VLIEGGFPSNRAVAICGATGTGKTSFGLQFLAEGVERGETGIFVAVDEKPRHLIEDAASLGIDLEALMQTGSLAILDSSPYFTATRSGNGARSGVEPRQMAADLVQQVRRLAARRLVIDSATSLVPPALVLAQAYDYLRSLIQSLEDNLACTILLTCRPSRLDPQGSYEAIRALATGVVELALRKRGGERVRTIRVHKMRGTAIDLAEHRLSVERDSGISVSGLAESVEAARLFRQRPRAVDAEAPQPSDRPEAV
jgi:KaiC/GvpD/RAD55 family RecA-like ATPase